MANNDSTDKGLFSGMMGYAAGHHGPHGYGYGGYPPSHGGYPPQSYDAYPPPYAGGGGYPPSSYPPPGAYPPSGYPPPGGYPHSSGYPPYSYPPYHSGSTQVRPTSLSITFISVLVFRFFVLPFDVFVVSCCKYLDCHR